MSLETARKQPPEDRLPSAFDLLGPSWRAFKVNWIIFIFGIVAPIAVILLFVAILQIAVHFTLNGSNVYGDSSGMTAVNVISVILGAGAVIFALPLAGCLYYYTKMASAQGVKLRYWASLKASLHYFWRIIGLAIVRWIIIIVGLILLIAPGLFMWRRYLLAPYYLMDEDLKIGEAMRRSAADSKVFSGAIWGLIGVYIVVTVVSGIFNIIPLVGWIVGVALSLIMLCMASVRYYQIKAAK